MTENDKSRLCESCGAGFSCSASSGECWCFEIPVETDARGVIAGLFKDCLCPECLLKYSRAGSEPKEFKR